jgi:conjugative relaxase-like TrwC/TraI family protein
MRPWNISGSQAKEYYYHNDVVFGSKDNSQWHGELAKEFGLSGICEEHDFLNMVAGNDPKGNQIIQDGVNGEHRAAIDIPLAAPKSVSVLALHCGKKELIEAQETAVAATIDYIQRNYLYARKTTDGVTLAFKTENGLFSTFTHSTSRANDPHLHTHTLIMNMTRTPAGWRAIFNDPIFKDQTLINYVYQSELAKNVRALGYGIENDAKGKWGIAGFKQEWVEAFSTRSNEIDEEMQRLTASSEGPLKEDAKTRDMAQKSSRADKELDLTHDQLKELWQAKVDRQIIIASVEAAKQLGHDLSTDLSPKDYIKIAYDAIHENESTFIRQDVLKVALELSRGQCTIGDIEKAFAEAVKRGEIEHLASYVNKKGLETTIYSSREMRLTEQGIVRTFNQHAGTMTGLFSQAEVHRLVEANYDYFTHGQKAVVQHILTSKSRFIIIQGDAGTGKTSALSAVKHIADELSGDKPVCITGLGYTGKASHEIMEKAGIASQTLHRFLSQQPSGQVKQPQLWVVDESSMIGSRQLDEVMRRAIHDDAQVAFIGDGKQLQAIGAGRMFKDLQKHGHVETVKMEEALRQKSNYMKRAVSHVKQFQEGKSSSGIDDAFQLLEEKGRVHAISRRGRRLDRAAAAFLKHPDQQSCLILSPVNEDRIAINDIVHNAVKPDGARELDVEIHLPVFMKGTSRYFAKNYRSGQSAFIDTSNVKGLPAGIEVRIAAVDVEKNRLLFEVGSKQIDVDLARGDLSFSVYEREQRTFFEGEKIVFMKNNKTLNVSNGQTAFIKSIGPQRVITAAIEGQQSEVKINLDFYPYVDRGYAVTVHKGQGQTAKEVMLVTDSKNPLNKTETFYVSLSRAENNFSLYTDRPDVVKWQFKEAQPKTSTVDIFADKSGDMSHTIQKSGP